MACQPIWNELKLITLIIKIFYIGAKGRVNDDKIFELDNLIAFLHIAKNKTINPVSRATVGLMNDGDWAAIKKNVFG